MIIPPGVYVAQVVDIHPNEYQVSVQFSDLSQQAGARVKLGAAFASPSSGEYDMPPLFSWGHVVINNDTGDNGYFLRTLPDEGRNNIPTELLSADPRAKLTEYRSNKYTIEHGDGSTETVLPDNTLIRTTTTKDETIGNTTNRAKRTTRKVTRTPEYGGTRERKTRDIEVRPPVDIEIVHSSGTVVRVTADGSIRLQTAKGHLFRLWDDTERARDDDGNVTDSGVSATRPNSGIYLESEKGLKVTLHDDPNSTDLFLKLETPDGRSVLLDDKNNKTVITDANRVEIVSPEVYAGDGSSTYKVARADKVEAEFQALQSYLASHSHAVVTGFGGVVLAVLAPTSPPPNTAADATASTKLKVKE